MSNTNGKTHIAQFIKPLNLVLDLAVITFLGHTFLNNQLLNPWHFWLYQSAIWLIVSYFSGFYAVYRFMNISRIAYLAVRQFAVFCAAVACFFLFAKYAHFNSGQLLRYCATTVISISLIKLLVYLYTKTFKVNRPVKSVALGTESFELLRKLPNGNVQDITVFTREMVSEGKGFISSAMDYALLQGADTLYCRLSAIKPSQVHRLKEYSASTNLSLKFIPDTYEIYKGLYINYFDDMPVFSIRKTPLDNFLAKTLKRAFDIVFSAMVIVFILSWLTPIIALFIKLESKGPVFFKQGRPGINESEFMCFKFRSMGVNRTSEAMAVKNDMRVTKTGKFLRKTSLDELPQFFNVFLGDMSVVGPRPQIWFHNNEYKGRIHKFSNRLYVKPGITGLAQVSGYRGEINTDAEMQNRIRYDVFYIENWSILLDLKIIIQTVVNIFMGEEKAY